MRRLVWLALTWTLWVQDGALWQPVRTFADPDVCIAASWRVGFLTGRLAECRQDYRL